MLIGKNVFLHIVVNLQKKCLLINLVFNKLTLYHDNDCLNQPSTVVIVMRSEWQ